MKHTAYTRLALAALIFTGTCMTYRANADTTPPDKTAAAAEAKETAPASRHQAVLDLRPVGYWPADDGSGDVLRDLSPTDNDAVLHHVPWVDGLLDFTGAYQWAEIPASPAYQTPAFSMGGWFYARSPFFGGLWPNTDGMLFFGNKDWQGRFGIQLNIRKQEVIEVLSHDQNDVVGTRLWDPAKRLSFGEPTLPIGQWHHLLYTFEPTSTPRPPASPDLARLATASASDASTPAALIDGDPATSWQPSAPGTSIRLDFPSKQFINFLRLQPAAGSPPLPAGRFDFSDGTSIQVDPFSTDWKVLFWYKTITWLTFTFTEPLAPGAALSALSVQKEPVTIYSEEGVLPAPSFGSPLLGRGSLYVNGKLVATRDNIPYLPADLPLHIAPDAQWWHQVDHKSGSLDGSVRDLAWFDRPLTASEVTRLHEATRPDVTPAPNTAPQPTSPLPVAYTPAEREELVALLSGPDEPAAALAALALANAKATETVPALAAALQAELDRNGERAPRIEDLRRNALLRALLDLAPEDPRVLPLLDRGLFRPLFALYDLENPDLREVRDALDAGRPLDAYRHFLRLNPRDPAQNFFTFRDRERRHTDYTPFTRHGDTTYQVNEGVAWLGGERISDADYADLAARIPGFAEWRPASHPHLYRIPIIKIDANGHREKVYLGGPDFVLDGEDAKVIGWSIFVDRHGFIHLFGGQHNNPDPALFAPGTWEALPASRDRSDPDFPAQMYWVSQKPGDITTMEFVGRRNDPRSIPANYLNYMTIVQHPAHGTYLYGRVEALGWQSWGAFRYDADARRWHEVGGDPHALLQNAFAANPDWRRFLHSTVCGKIPDAPTEFRILAWAWQPPFYNFCRDDWGLRFDRTGRLHVHLQISGLDENGRLVPSGVYAWSDDGGTTFHRADGSPVKLPLTLNPAPDHRTNIRDEDQARWWDTWISLVPSHGIKPSR